LNPTGYPQVIEELSGPIGSGTVQRVYTYGLQRISEDLSPALTGNSTWTPSYYGYDGGGTVRYLTNSTGGQTDTYDYDAFGNLVRKTGTTPNNYLYRGEQYDSDLGLYYLRARYYNPATGRFLSRDPLDGNMTDPKTLHKYLYAGGDPVNAMDPTGRIELMEYLGTIKKVLVSPGMVAARNALAAACFVIAVRTIAGAPTFVNDLDKLTTQLLCATVSGIGLVTYVAGLLF
jgi:RHS repeat-associated protein